MQTFLFLIACAPTFELSDSSDAPSVDGVSLAPAYLAGGRVDLTLLGDGADIEFASIESADTSVFSLGETDSWEAGKGERVLSVNAEAVAPGETEVIVRDLFGTAVLVAPIRVALPSEIELAWTDRLSGDREPVIVESPTVFVDGQAVFDIAYLDGTDELFATADVQVPNGSALDGWVESGNRLSIEPQQAGRYDIELQSGKYTLGRITGQAVGAEAIADVVLAADDESGRNAGDELAVVAQAYDAGDERIFGVPFAWSNGRGELEDMGDTFIYTYLPSKTVSLRVGGGTDSAEVVVHGVQARAGDADPLACAVANIGPVGSAIVLALLGIGRRRARRQQG